MTARLRVLQAMLHRNEFTAADLAQLSGVSLATVRTVIDRERQRLEEVSRLSEDRRGGRWQLYRVRPDARQGITRILSAAADLQSADQELPPCPSTLVAAEDYLVRQFEELPKDREQILAQERRDLDTARALIERSPAHHPYRSRLEILDAIWHIRKDTPDSRQTALSCLVSALASSKAIERAPAALAPATVVAPPVDAAQDAATPHAHLAHVFVDLLRLFRELLNQTPASAPADVRIRAAIRFRREAGRHVWLERHEFPIHKMLRQQDVQVGLQCIPVIGCDYNSYSEGAVKILEGGLGLAIRSFSYVETDPEPASAPPEVAPITRAMTARAGA